MQRSRTALTLICACLLVACGGSSTAQREPGQTPPPGPNADVGDDAASRDAALRRADPLPPARPATEP